MKLDEDYKNADYIPGAEAFPPRWQAEAADFRAALGDRATCDITYGPSDRQKLDLFLPQGAPLGLMMFVHGGYWQAFDKTSWSHLAAGALARGWAVALPSYDLCPDVTIAQITQQIAAAVQCAAARITGPIALAGHSAGGHLVARMLDPQVLPADLRARIKNVVPISPLGDLAPLLQTSMNKVLGLDPAMARAESPLHMRPPRDTSVTIWVGQDERPAFLQQAETLAAAWGAPCVVAKGKHHFDVIDPLVDPDSDLVTTLLSG